MVRHLPGDIPTRAGRERRGFTTALTLDVSTICVGYRPVVLPAMLIPAGLSANRNRGRSCSRRPTAGRATDCKTTYLERHVVPWLLSSLVPLNLFKPPIAKRFEAGAEEAGAVAQVIKLGCRLAPPSHLRLVKPNRIQRKSYPTKSAHTSMSPMPGVLEEPRKASSRAAS